MGLAAIALAARFVPESRAPIARRPDPGGQALLIVVLGSLTYAIIEGPDFGWHTPAIIALFAISAVALAVFIAFEARRPEPVLDPRFFRSVPFAGAVLTAISAFAALGGFLFLITLYLQDVRGLSPLDAGLHLAPMAVAMAIAAVASSRILARWGGRVPMVVAGAAMAAGAMLLSGLTTSWSTPHLILAFAVFGIGAGAVNAPITQAAVSGMPAAQAGVASGMASTSRQVGTSLGVAITGSILAANLHGPLTARFVAASHADWLLLAACGAAVGILGLVTTTRWALNTATRTAATLRGDRAQDPRHDALMRTSRQVGASLGVAVTGLILVASLDGPLRGRFMPASRADRLLAAWGAAVLFLGLITVGHWTLNTASRTAAPHDATEPRTPVMIG